MCFKRSKKQVRLNKRISVKEKCQKWINNNRTYLLIVGSIVALVLFVYLCLAFVPGTESGIVYNNRTGVI